MDLLSPPWVLSSYSKAAGMYRFCFWPGRRHVHHMHTLSHSSLYGIDMV